MFFVEIEKGELRVLRVYYYVGYIINFFKVRWVKRRKIICKVIFVWVILVFEVDIGFFCLSYLNNDFSGVFFL